MWRRLLALAHPDGSGDHDLFIWTEALREHVAGDAINPPIHHRPRRTTHADSPRVPYEDAFDRAANFDELTRQAVARAGAVEEPYARLLRLLADCRASYDGRLYHQQHHGATYRSLAAIGHMVGMSVKERSRWYRIAEGIPLSQRHAVHILDRLQERAA